MLTDLDKAPLDELSASLGGDRVATVVADVRDLAAFVKGIDGRKRGVFCPRWVGLARWLKPVIASPVGERETLKLTPELMPKMDAEAAALGRNLSARTDALERPATH